jgi:hypothetical protein
MPVNWIHNGGVCIRTPFHREALVPKCQVFNSDRSSSPTDDTTREYAKDTRMDSKSTRVTDQMLSAAMSDPITMMYDAWWYLSSDGSSSIELIQPLNAQQQYDAEESPESEQSCSKNSRKDATAQDERFKHSVWTDVCILHVIGMISVAATLIPSITNPSILACNAISGVNASTWPVLNSSTMMFGISWTCCCVLQFVFGLHKLALCTSMHTVARLMLAYASMALSCPLPPVCMPTAVASGTGMLIGLLLLFVSQMRNASTLFSTEDFYMNHAWAHWVALLVMRHTVLRLAVCVYAYVNNHYMQGLIMQEQTPHGAMRGSGGSKQD